MSEKFCADCERNSCIPQLHGGSFLIALIGWRGTPLIDLQHRRDCREKEEEEKKNFSTLRDGIPSLNQGETEREERKISWLAESSVAKTLLLENDQSVSCALGARTQWLQKCRARTWPSWPSGVRRTRLCSCYPPTKTSTRASPAPRSLNRNRIQQDQTLSFAVVVST